jgi:hypothetical protein
MSAEPPTQWNWEHERDVPPYSFDCGYCGHRVGPNRGYQAAKNSAYVYIRICSFCRRPTFVDQDGSQHPGVAHGSPVEHLPADVRTLYDEARRCMSVSAHTSAVLACRKILMHVAVDQGVAEEGESFVHYVDALAKANYVPPGGRKWVDRIRRAGNEATHEIATKNQTEAEQVLRFTSSLLQFIYELGEPDEEPEVAEVTG